MNNLRRHIMMHGAVGDNRYIQDGLVFYLDCEKDCSSQLWKDQINGYEFAGQNVQVIGGAPYFSNAYYSRQALYFNYNNCTLECVFKRLRSQNEIMFIDGTNNGSAIGIYDNNLLFTEAGKNMYGVIGFQFDTNLRSISYHNEYIYINGVAQNQFPIGYWSPYGQACIGGRLTNGTLLYPFTGYIYCIRIYSRQLSHQEVWANAKIDIERWG